MVTTARSLKSPTMQFCSIDISVGKNCFNLIYWALPCDAVGLCFFVRIFIDAKIDESSFQKSKKVLKFGFSCVIICV